MSWQANKHPTDMPDWSLGLYSPFITFIEVSKHQSWRAVQTEKPTPQSNKTLRDFAPTNKPPTKSLSPSQSQGDYMLV